LFLDLGWSGVDLFFVLSGFLITGILLDTRDSASFFRIFYIRRALRIFPVYFLYVLAVLAFTRPAGGWWYLTYLMNWKAGHGVSDHYLGHLWSLAVEEQFYFVWPAVVYLVPRRRLAPLCLLLAVAAPLCRWWVGMGAEAAYRLTPCRMDALALGALVSIAQREFPARLKRWVPWVLIPAAGGLLNIVLLRDAGFWGDPRMQTAGASLIAVVGACLVAVAATRPRSIVSGACDIPFLRACGRYSYVMYVAQLVLLDPAQRLATALVPAAHPAARCAIFFAAAVVLTLSAGWLSWRIVELPFHRLKDRFPYAPAAKAAGA
jgi:peptidoglycan/LPS O-acetylase OafA/YrhL